MSSYLHPCSRCGWVRTTKSRAAKVCTNCKANPARFDPGDERIEWEQVGLIQRGTVYPPTRKTGTNP